VREADLDEPQSCTRVWVDDVNSDGKLDVLVGDLVTLISPADHLTEKEFKRKFADWNKSIEEANKQLNSAGDDEKKQNAARQRFQELYSRRSEFMKEDRTGFVWLYLRK
jgi:hypothetical protein